MGRVADRLAALRGRGEAALVAYVMAGHPTRAGSAAAVRGAVRGGADIVELGFPFSDPLADGPAIQAAAQASLSGGMDMAAYLRMAASLARPTGVPLAMMTYANIFERHGAARLAARMARAGISAAILPDLPVDESSAHAAAMRGAGIDTVFLASPNTGPGRMRRIAAASTGFAYLVAVYGTTGQAGRGVAPHTTRAIRALRRAARGVPVGVGFGISSPGDVRECVAAGADAVVVGSPIVRLAGAVPRARIEADVARYVASLKRATRPQRRASRGPRQSTRPSSS